jgi:hypothetical protein
MGVDGDGGRREFGRRGPRRGIENDKETAADSLVGCHAPGLKKTLACLRAWSCNNEARRRTRRQAPESQPAGSSALSRQRPNRPSDEDKLPLASTTLDPLVEFL